LPRANSDSWLLNVAYTLPVHWGPISRLEFYNGYSQVLRKSGGFPKTHMDVLGVKVSAGKVHAFIDLVTAKNQPFIGGSIAPPPTSGRSWNTRFNINVGYHF
jgi:hypothetical protein